MCEKPLARSAGEAEAIVVKAEERGWVVKTSSNNCYFQSVAQSYTFAMSGTRRAGELNGRSGNNGERLRSAWFGTRI